MMRSTLFLLLITAAVLPALVAGCSGPSGPATVPVNGTLTIDGTPANNVTITLVPSDPGLEAAAGQVNNGTFQLYTGVQGVPGAVPGKYKVVLSQATSADQDAAAYTSEAGGPPEQKLSFPEKYKSAQTSDKEVTVPPGGGDLKIDLSS